MIIMCIIISVAYIMCIICIQGCRPEVPGAAARGHPRRGAPVDPNVRERGYDII